MKATKQAVMEFRGIKAQYRHYQGEIDAALAGVLEAGTFIGGSPVRLLEEHLADYVGVRHCLSCASGTDALTLVLKAWGIGPGDAVFVPDFTFVATASTAALEGATPVFVDVDDETFTIDPAALERAVLKVIEAGELTPKVIVPVDLFGLPADYPTLRRLADHFGLRILEDAAQGFGGSISGQRAGSFGDAAITSFFPAKPLGCYGDGGAIFTDDDELASLLGSLKVHGKGTSKYDTLRLGLNSRLDTVQAAILSVKLDGFDQELEQLNSIYARYTERLDGLVRTPVIPEGWSSSFAQYTIQLPDRAGRDRLQQLLADEGIPSMVYYPGPLSMQPVFREAQSDGRASAGRASAGRAPAGAASILPEKTRVTRRLCETVLSLPMHPYLSLEDVQTVSDHISRFIYRR